MVHILLLILKIIGIIVLSILGLALLILFFPITYVGKVNGNIVSRKGENHGIGLDNVKRIVDKYDGTMVIECDNGRFDIDVIMFVG